MRRGEPWRKYAALLERLGEDAGVRRVPAPARPEAWEGEFVAAFARRLRPRAADPGAARLLDEVGVSAPYFRQHLRYFAGWEGLRRQQLAAGAALGLLERLTDAQVPALAGLDLSGSVTQQEATLAGALAKIHSAPPAPKQVGWLAPAAHTVPGDRGVPRRDIWLYPRAAVPTQSALHPEIVRLLIRKYVRAAPGVVIDPMAGSGVVGLEATRLGHRAWVSDRQPAQPFIAAYDLLGGGRRDDDDLAQHLGDVDANKADLLVLHPPLRAELLKDDPQLEAFVEHLVGQCASAVKVGGKVALIVDLMEAPGALETLSRTLTETLSTSATRTRKQRPTFGLVGHHVAVARDGSQGWHLLVAQNA